MFTPEAAAAAAEERFKVSRFSRTLSENRERKKPLEVRGIREGGNFRHFTATNLVGGKQPDCVDKHRLRLSSSIEGLWDEPTNMAVNN